MEGERANVAALVFLLLVEALLKFAVLLETVFLGHLALLLIRLHDASFAAERLHLAVKHLIFTELAFQRTVVHWNLDARLQSYLFETFFTVRQNPSLATHKLMLQSFANHAIGSQQVRRRDAFAIRRIGHQDALLLGLFEVLEVLLFHGDVSRQSGSARIQSSGVHRLHVDIIAINMVFELAFL